MALRRNASYTTMDSCALYWALMVCGRRSDSRACKRFWQLVPDYKVLASLTIVHVKVLPRSFQLFPEVQLRREK